MVTVWAGGGGGGSLVPTLVEGAFEAVSATEGWVRWCEVAAVTVRLATTCDVAFGAAVGGACAVITGFVDAGGMP